MHWRNKSREFDIYGNSLLMRALILNDTARGGHPGCVLVMRQLLNGCRGVGIIPVAQLPVGRGFSRSVQEKLPECDLVIINGEGTLHHDGRAALALAAAGVLAHNAGKPLALINTVWQQNDSCNELLGCASLVYTRESRSARQLREAGCAAEVVPDLLLSCHSKDLFIAPVGPGPVVVLDDVRWETALILARYARERGLPFLRMTESPSSPKALLQWGRLCLAGGFGPRLGIEAVQSIMDASLVVTGRFHGVCLAILAQRPIVALQSNTHKIEGLFEDAGLGECAVLVEQGTFERQPFGAIDKAVMQVQASALDPELFSAYCAACAAYSARGRKGAQAMFGAIAAMARSGGTLA